MSERFLIYGHRGSPRRFPENTPESFEETLRAGADGFETDLRLLSDQTAILFHDDELAEREIESMTAPELGGTLTPLRELARFAGRTTMILEVKRSRWEEALIAEISSWPNVVVASFDHRTIDTLAQLGAGFELGLTVYGRIVGLAPYAARLGARWVFPAYRFVDRALVASCHDAGIKVVPWTPNREKEWAFLREIGCDGVITDLPAEAVQWRATPPLSSWA